MARSSNSLIYQQFKFVQNFLLVMVNSHGISIPPHSARVLVRAPVTLPVIVPPRRTTRQQILELSFGRCPTVLFLFISAGTTAMAYLSCALPLSCLDINVSPMKGLHISLYTWYPLTALGIVTSNMPDDSAMLFVIGKLFASWSGYPFYHNRNTE